MNERDIYPGTSIKAGGDCGDSDDYFGLWVGERDKERWERQGDKGFGHLVWSLLPSLAECPKGTRLVSLKALKTPHETCAWLWNKYQDHSWIVFKLNAICQSCEPSFHTLSHPHTHTHTHTHNLSFFHLKPASFCSSQRGFQELFFSNGKKGKDLCHLIIWARQYLIYRGNQLKVKRWGRNTSRNGCKVRGEAHRMT